MLLILYLYRLNLIKIISSKNNLKIVKGLASSAIMEKDAIQILKKKISL